MTFGPSAEPHKSHPLVDEQIPPAYSLILPRPWLAPMPHNCPNCNVDILHPKLPPGALLRSAADRVEDHFIRREPQRDFQTTTDLPPFGYKVPRTLQEMFSVGASKYGHTYVSRYLACPELARLKSLGVRVKRDLITGPVELNNLDFGSFVHSLLATRAVYGHDQSLMMLEYFRPELVTDDYLKLLHTLKIYDITHPAETEPFKYLGIEVEVFTNIGDGKGNPLVRSVRYDGLIFDGNSVYSLERKTASRGGNATINSYTPQFMVQVALWNTNDALVQKFGKMNGTLVDLVIKTTVPKCERHARHFSRLHEERALEYLRLPEHIKFPANEDGSHARMLHTCQGKYSSCEYMSLCFEQAVNDYELAPAP